MINIKIQLANVIKQTWNKKTITRFFIYDQG
jgi:hypothetical protein